MKIETIKKRSRFLEISKDNFSYYSKNVVVLAAKSKDINSSNEVAFCRVGYTVTKKIGNAVIRNKCRRRFREIFRSVAPNLAQNNFEYVILARKEILNSDFKKIKSDIEFCLKGISYNIKKSSKS